LLISGGLQLMLEATVGDSLSLDPLSFCQDGATPPAVDVGRGEIVDALVVSAVVVVGNEGFDLGFEIAGQEVIFQQDAVLEGLVPAKRLNGFSHRSLKRLGRIRTPNAMTNGRKKQVARLIKCECAECGYVARVARQWIDDQGAPHCPAHGEMTAG
jgi:hypothetical protein